MLRDDGLTRPLAARLRANHPRRDEILLRHDESVEAGLPTYRDPISGFAVFTAAFLATRASCCGSGCRHCPFVDPLPGPVRGT